MSSVATTTDSAQRPQPPDFTRDQIRDYLSDLEGVLRRVDSGRTYYQILGVDRAVEQETLRSSYQRLLDLLYPSYPVASMVPAEVALRVERAFAKLSQAFGVLASFARRQEYDSALLSTAQRPTQTAAKVQHSSPKPAQSDSANQRDGSTPVRLNASPAPVPLSGQVFSVSSQASSDNNRRRCGRMKLAIPVRVIGHEQANGKWSEMGETIDVSRTGARLNLRKRVRQGTVLFLTLPLPTKLRAHGFSEQGYNVYVLIRTVDPPKKGMRAVGVEFLGERPPAGFLEKPWAVYRAKRSSAVERRRHRREERAEAVEIEYLDENGQSIGRDHARSENVGPEGVRVAGTSAPPEFDLVSVTCPNLKFHALAVIRDRYRGKDGLERLCLQLVDKAWPSR